MKKKALVLLILFLSGCAYVEPLVEQFNIVSTADEAKIGAQVQTQVSQQMKVISSGADYQEVNQIGATLLNALPRRDYSYKFYVVEDDTPNAFTIPGGIIYVHTGLLKMTDRDELAGVMAHEIGHAYDRHPAKGISRQFGAEYLTQLVFKKNQPQLQKMGWQLAQQSLLLRYGRYEEFKADEIGYNILSRSGFRTDGLIRFFRKLQAMSAGGGVPAFMSTHPPTQERIARLEALENAIRAGNLPPIT